MGKAGKQEIRKNQVVSVVEANVNYGVDGIADDIKRAIRTENVNGILNALYPEAQSIMDKNVSAEYLQEDVERFSKNIDVLCQVDPATAYRYAAALLISADASPLHDTAERVAVASLSALAKNDPDSAKISADIAVELGPRSNLQTRLANAVRHLSSAESPDTGRREWSSMSAPEQFMVLAKIQVDDFLEGKVSEDGIPKAVRNLGETLETYAKSAPKEVAGFCADMLLNPDLDRFSEVAGKAYGGAMKALQSVDVGAAISTAKEHLDNYGGIAAIATVATVVAASVATKSAPVSLVRNVAKNGMSA